MLLESISAGDSGGGANRTAAIVLVAEACQI